MGPGFFPHHWDIVGADVISLVKEFFGSEEMRCGLNDTNLVLIPKKKNFVVMGHLRPISFCNVLYKIISKVLANRMRDLIDCIISDTQSSFILNHLISDNVMVAFEVMHYLKRKRRGNGLILLWSVSLRFATKLFIMAMYLSLSPVKRNPSRQSTFYLSTYLFIICAEDDSYLFCQATRGVANSISNLLHLFENASSQKVNYSKSSIFFSPNTNATTRAQGAKDLVRLGVARVIGDGRTTSIIGSPWLPSTSNKYVSSNHPGLSNHIITNGNSSVQSAYNLLQSRKPVSLRPNNFGFWRKFWHLKIPPKVLNFLWHGIAGSLPTCVNLVTKHVPISSQCPVCHTTAETTTHALLTCDFARACWSVFGWPVMIDSSSTFGHWFELLQNTSDIDFICHDATLCWALWKA
uniref:Reverse transcriptase zinc-binding domain-containing protein n=1 Tax=Cannabis sativa TaxID=3483 RepID=A0A803P1J6_CANSA